jgi:hypothetical protein
VESSWRANRQRAELQKRTQGQGEPAGCILQCSPKIDLAECNGDCVLKQGSPPI